MNFLEIVMNEFMYKLLTLLVFLFGCSVEPTPVVPAIVVPVVKEVSTIQYNVFSYELMERALAEDKLLLIYFHDKYCEPARHMHLTLADPQVIRVINEHYIFASVNVLENNNIGMFDAFRDIFSLRGLPNTFIMTVTKEHNWPVAEIVGYKDPDRYASLLLFISSKLNPDEELTYEIGNYDLTFGPDDYQYCKPYDIRDES